MNTISLKGKKVLVMGLGLHGGGVETARYLVEAGAYVTCTDIQDETALESSLQSLEGLDIRYVLGRHETADFDAADLIIKNPAVPAASPWIAGRSNIETDISLFLMVNSSPIIAVTGSKGKSTVVSALNHILKTQCPGTRLGGNITVSPLSFVHELCPQDTVILELSSWQLADLKGRGLLRPEIACITNLMHDHQNSYTSFSDYEKDKTVVFESPSPSGTAVFPDDDFGRKWASGFPGEVLFIGKTVPAGEWDSRRAWLEDGVGYFGRPGEFEEILPSSLKVPGEPFRLNGLFAAAMARLQGYSAGTIRDAMGDFAGVSYRMEMFLETSGLRFYDDTTATIPDAAAAAVQAMDRPVILIAGGTDKGLEFSAFDPVARIPKRIIMLEGSATDIWLPRLQAAGASVGGPYCSMDTAVDAALSHAAAGDAVVLSPGAASFGMFRHEFERGDLFKAACRRAVHS